MYKPKLDGSVIIVTLWPVYMDPYIILVPLLSRRAIALQRNTKREKMAAFVPDNFFNCVRISVSLVSWHFLSRYLNELRLMPCCVGVVLL
jgi:hypothetical protein